MRALVLVNPRARRLRRGRLAADQVQAILGRAGDVIITKDLDHLREVLEHELDDTVACIVTVGGDGALHWAMNLARPIAEARGLRLPPLLPARSGTIDFVARKVQLEGSPAAILARLAERVRGGGAIESRHLQTARFRFEHVDGTTRDLIGFASAIGGDWVPLLPQLHPHPDPSPATIVSVIARAVSGFPFGTAHAREMFRPQRARVLVDGELVPHELHSGIHVGSIDLDLGGVLRVFPFAKDGALHIHAGVLEPKEIIGSLPALYRGTSVGGEKFIDRGGATLEVEAGQDEPLRPILDGERYPDTKRLVVERGPLIEVALV